MDDVLVHVLSPNVYRTPSEALQAFQWFSKVSLVLLYFHEMLSSRDRQFKFSCALRCDGEIANKERRHHLMKNPVMQISMY